MGTEKNGCEKKCAFDRHEECPACVQNMSHEACTRHFLDRSHASIPRLDTEILLSSLPPKELSCGPVHVLTPGHILFHFVFVGGDCQYLFHIF